MTTEILYREMSPAEIDRIGEIRRRESTHLVEVEVEGPHGLRFTLDPPGPPVDIPDWSEAGVAHRIESFGAKTERMYGAFIGDRLAGFATVDKLEDQGASELSALFVDFEQRQKGIGSNLLGRAESGIREAGGKAIYAYSNPTLSSVRFYLSHGFRVTGLVARDIVESLPGDIIVAKVLD